MSAIPRPVEPGRSTQTLVQDDDLFRELLHPVEETRFFAEYWDKAALHLAGHADKFQHLPGIGEIPSLLAGSLTTDRWSAPAASISGSFLDQNGAVRNMGVVPASMLPALYNAGVSLCLSSVGAGDPRVMRYLQRLKQALRYPGEVLLSGYLTPPQSGSELHFDSQHVFMLQIAGEKRWRVSTTPATPAPPFNLSAANLADNGLLGQLRRIDIKVSRPEDMEFAEITLKPGDALYLPPGTWHEPRTIERSFHYSLTLMPLGILQILTPILRTLIIKTRAWRRDLRFSDGQQTSEKEMAEHVRDALQRLAAEIERTDPEALLRPMLSTPAPAPARREPEGTT